MRTFRITYAPRADVVDGVAIENRTTLVVDAPTALAVWQRYRCAFRDCTITNIERLPRADNRALFDSLPGANSGLGIRD